MGNDESLIPTGNPCSSGRKCLKCEIPVRRLASHTARTCCPSLARRRVCGMSSRECRDAGGCGCLPGTTFFIMRFLDRVSRKHRRGSSMPIPARLPGRRCRTCKTVELPTKENFRTALNRETPLGFRPPGAARPAAMEAHPSPSIPLLGEFEKRDQDGGSSAVGVSR